MLLPQEIIRTKRDGLILSADKIQGFVDGLVNGSFNDAQVGSMAMAIFQQGMEIEEIVAFTKAMMNSGDVLSWPELDGPVVDKHSTGGVGDKVSFMLAAIVAACGAYVPMISGRGLGHTGGTSDKLESIAGFNVQPTISEFKRIVKDIGVAIISQTDNLAPADKRLYSIRDVTGTVESIPLITASILSKKLSAGLDTLVMDVKMGNGAMMSDMTQAIQLAQSIVSVANGAGVPTQAIITDMNQVLGTSAGNAVEMYETVKYLTGKQREPRLHAVVVALATSMLISSKIANTEAEAKTKINAVLANGEAAEVFSKMIAALGGPNNLLEAPWESMTKANVIKDVIATRSGYISGMQTRDIGLSIVGMKGGRTANGQLIDHSVGFDRILPVGTVVNKGDAVARIHAANEEQATKASQEYLTALSISETKAEELPVIYKIID
ncbi:thymidine phosphorylase [Pseudocolwellia agarivorans]|uniref:thymidine phosphorylase n=1 Tax=Pseudocolwellia agarivorans TaxID=1911682 RepID=UPI0009876345|nr:thymidine phosphorylase [Pseudocolwellia agarivorans]